MIGRVNFLRFRRPPRAWSGNSTSSLGFTVLGVMHCFPRLVEDSYRPQENRKNLLGDLGACDPG